MKKISIFIRDFSHIPQCGTCIDKDGTNSGFDIELINHIRDNVSIPVIASSGAGKVEHFSEVFEKTKAEAALTAGIFHREEIPIEAVKDLI
ncbi:HisA/HisF-related TIM barrel protein [Thermodesulfobacteriota bacterium]